MPRLRFAVSFLLLALLVATAAARETAPVAAKLQPFVNDGTLAGAVTLVATKDEVLSTEAIGYADIAGGKTMATDSLFWIASMSKPITGVALMMLVDEGKVNLDDPVEKYLPEFKGMMVAVEKDADHVLMKKPQKAITLRHILSHTSGLAHFSPLETPTLDRWPLEARVRSYPLSPLMFEPETKYAYSNQGINTAGRIVEVVSGMPFEKSLDERLFKPLGMNDTTFWPNDEQAKRIATSYKTGDDGKLAPMQIQYLSYPLTDRSRGSMPGGGLFSTAGDVGTLCRMVLAGGELGGKRYLSEAAVKEMTKIQTGKLPTTYGLGWAIDKEPGTGFGHGGAYATSMKIDPATGLIKVFMVQYAGKQTDRWKEISPTFNKAVDEAYGK